MTTATLVSAVACTGLAPVLFLQAAETAKVAPSSVDPWVIGAILAPLATFCGWLVRWILMRQDARDAVTAKRDDAREDREEKRAVQVELQTRAMQECVTELRRLNDQQQQLPERIVDRLHGEGLVQRKPA